MLSIPVFLCVTSYGNVVHRFSNLQLCVQWTSVIIFRLVSYKYRRLRIFVGYRVVYPQWLIAAGLSTAELRRSGLGRSKLYPNRGSKLRGALAPNEEIYMANSFYVYLLVLHRMCRHGHRYES